MRELDMMPLRWHMGEPTWDTIDELIEHIDYQEDDFRSRMNELEGEIDEERRDLLSDVDAAYEDGYTEGYSRGLSDGEENDD